jgi:hypothetical protein
MSVEVEGKDKRMKSGENNMFNIFIHSIYLSANAIILLPT